MQKEHKRGLSTRERDPKVTTKLVLIVKYLYEKSSIGSSAASVSFCGCVGHATQFLVIDEMQTLRRLAQNREAARKSRLRKKVSESSNSFITPKWQQAQVA